MNELAIKHGTDKSTHHHGYTRTYEPLFAPLRTNPVSVLELGWGGHEDPDAGGASALLWRDYFVHPKRVVSVVDNEEKTITAKHAGVNFCLGSQADPDFIAQVAGEYGPFDIVIDDASHLSSLTIKSFELLWKHVKSGGLYVVEDTHMAYHDFYYGKNEAHPDPDGRTQHGAPTAMQFLRRLSDETNFRSDGALFPEKYWKGYDVDWVMFTYNLCVVKRL